MKNLEKAIEAVLELELDYDTIIQDFDIYGEYTQELELEVEDLTFMITVEVDGQFHDEKAGWHDYDDYTISEFHGEITPTNILVIDKDENEFELKVSKQIIEQLKQVR